MQVKHLLHVWMSGGDEESIAARRGLEEKIDSYAAGELEHAAEAISCIWEFSNGEDTVLYDPSGVVSSSKRTSAISANVLKFTGCDLRPSLIKSIKEGYLFGRKYWVKRSREGDVEPIYFSSGVIWVDFDAGESLRLGSLKQLSGVVLGCHLGCGDHLDENDEDEDSDYENDAEKPVGQVSQEIERGSEQETEQKPFSVLKFGSSVT